MSLYIAHPSKTSLGWHFIFLCSLPCGSAPSLGGGNILWKPLWSWNRRPASKLQLWLCSLGLPSCGPRLVMGSLPQCITAILESRAIEKQKTLLVGGYLSPVSLSLIAFLGTIHPFREFHESYFTFPTVSTRKLPWSLYLRRLHCFMMEEEGFLCWNPWLLTCT